MVKKLTKICFELLFIGLCLYLVLLSTDIFKDATWFHLSGISLALGHRVRTFALKCLQACKKHNVTVSFDFNYRSKLWSIEEARPHFKKVIPFVDVLFANHFDIEEILEIKGDDDHSKLIRFLERICRKKISSRKRYK